ncbi:hypothetical protein BY996DRAFT_6472189 [Phakopsora pachyrhizi]|nr:hypothetical protein BY996DRAFT_6472189 [Phakopsora pachyrhizi]
MSAVWSCCAGSQADSYAGLTLELAGFCAGLGWAKAGQRGAYLVQDNEKKNYWPSPRAGWARLGLTELAKAGQGFAGLGLARLGQGLVRLGKNWMSKFAWGRLAIPSWAKGQGEVWGAKQKESIAIQFAIDFPGLGSKLRGKKAYLVQDNEKNHYFWPIPRAG